MNILKFQNRLSFKETFCSSSAWVNFRNKLCFLTVTMADELDSLPQSSGETAVIVWNRDSARPTHVRIIRCATS